MLEFSEVSHTYLSNSPRAKGESVKALNKINLKIEEGEFVCLLGPSGCGKSSLLNMAAGFMAPTSGSVRFKGMDIMAPGRERSVVFQESGLAPWLSVEDNIFLAMKDCERDSARLLLDEVLETVGLRGFNHFMPHELSGGMKQKVSIARSLAMGSELMLMDEPFSSLDEQTRLSLNRELVDLWRATGKTVLFITHSIQEAVVMGTRIVLLSKRPGEITGEWTLPDEAETSLEQQRMRLNDNRYNSIAADIRDSMELCCKKMEV